MKALAELLNVTTPGQLRMSVLKLYFTRKEGVVSPQDEEEIFFLLTFLEMIDRTESPQ